MHLFVINSSITFNVANGVIQKESLNKEECVFLYSRGVSFNPEIEQGDITAFDDLFQISLNFIKHRSDIAKFDKYIRGITKGQSFHLYIAHLGVNNFEVLSKHPDCKAISFLEEGTLSYLSKEIQNQKLHQRSPSGLKDFYYWLCFGNRKKRQDYCFGKTPENHVYYCSREECFPDVKNKIIVPLPLKDAKIGEVSHLLVLECLVEALGLSSEVYSESLKRMLAIPIKNGAKTIYYKFHPSQRESKEPIRQLINELSDKIEFKELDLAVNVEGLLFSGVREMYFTQSSAAIYASNECRLISNANDIDKSGRLVDHLPEFVRQKTTFI